MVNSGESFYRNDCDILQDRIASLRQQNIALAETAARLTAELAVAQAECDRRAILMARHTRLWWTVARATGITLDDEDWAVGLSELDQMVQAVIGEGNRLLDRAEEASDESE